MFSRLIVGTDGSRRAQLGIDLALKLARESHARIDIVHVCEHLVGGGSAGLPVLINEDEIVRSLHDQVRGLADQGYEPAGTTPEQFAEYIKTEIAKWTRVIKAAGLKAE